MPARPDLRRPVDHLESRLGARLGAALAADAPALPADVAERLRFARGQALERARLAGATRPALAATPAPRRLAGTAPVAAGTAIGPLSFGAAAGPLDTAGPSGWRRTAAWLPLALLLAGLMAIGHWTSLEQARVAGEIDTRLLTDTLPPEAYVDPGFVEFLRARPSS